MNQKLVLSCVTKIFNSEDGEMKSLEEISLNINQNEFLCIIGPSGCGKTTLLRLIAGLDFPSSGKIILDGEEIRSPSPERGMIFQDFSLFPWRTVLRNVEFGLEILGIERKREVAEEYLNLVGLNRFKNRYPYELSGGMKQRVAIARALAVNPAILLMDEPFGSLDAQTRNMLQDEILRIWGKTKKTVVFVTHSVDEALYLADRVVVMSINPGRIKKIIDVNMERPRERTDLKITEKRNEILDILSVELKKMTDR
ncbi:MAG: Trehalose/maltose import ATP-binding protein MalK [Candidatus Methanolliviera sp. GoM_asphalt]|nr:MAG: Trehalose/maltose import ATP-binding protein MalK [Candidatus Methanolliviera sp. GoM_asphalt]